MENQKEAYVWDLQKLVSELFWWSDFFNITFFKDQPVKVPAILFEKANVKTLGHYVPERNAFGLLENMRHATVKHLEKTLSRFLKPFRRGMNAIVRN